MNWLKSRWLPILAHIGAWLPLAILIWDYWHNQLTFNPIQEATFRTGKYALVLLILSLAITPLNSLFGWRQIVPLRKWFGLYAFMYAGLHFLIFVWLDYGLDLALLQEAIFQKRYALVGFGAFLILVPLALTSTRGWMKRLGKSWKRLHRLVYLAALLAVIHFVWLVKADIREPLIYGGVVILLLSFRLPFIRRRVSQIRTKLKPKRRTGPVSKPPALYG